MSSRSILVLCFFFGSLAHARRIHFINTATDTHRTIITRDILPLEHHGEHIMLGDIPLPVQDTELSAIDIVFDDDNATDIAFTTHGQNRTLHTRATGPPFSPFMMHNGTEFSNIPPGFLAFDTTYTINALLYTTPYGDTPFSDTNLRHSLVFTFTIVQDTARSTPTHDKGHASQSRIPIKPNIILILADDMAWSFTSVEMRKGQSNSKSPVDGFVTPNLERMAQDGLVFSRAYSCGPQCVPARACIISGQTAARNRLSVTGGARRKDTFQYEKYKKYGESPMIGVIPQELDDNLMSLPRALELQGYTSAVPGAHFGKWHLWPGPDDMGYSESDGRTNNNQGSSAAAGMGDDPKLMFSVTERGLGFIEDQVAAGNPFYLQLSHYACHQSFSSRWETRDQMLELPLMKEHYGRRDTDDIGGSDEAARYAMMYDLDSAVGQVLDKIDELQIKDNTYVIFTSDNGVNNKVWLKSVNDFDIPLKGAKWWLWEAGVRVPMIMTGPTVQKGAYTETPVIQYDFLPTILTLAGGSASSLPDIDGVDFSGVLQGGKLGSRDLIFHFPHATRGLCHSAMIDTSDHYKIMHFYNATEAEEVPLLFDLDKDEYEDNNRAKKKSSKHRKMKQRLLNYLASVQAGMPIENEDYEWEKYVEWNQYKNEARKWGPHIYED